MILAPVAQLGIVAALRAMVGFVMRAFVPTAFSQLLQGVASLVLSAMAPGVAPPVILDAQGILAAGLEKTVAQTWVSSSDILRESEPLTSRLLAASGGCCQAGYEMRHGRILSSSNILPTDITV